MIKAPPAALARLAGWPYLEGMMLDTAHQGPIEESAVPAPRPMGGVAFGIIAGSAVLVAALLLGASVLWIHYGTAVFFEMITSGIAACF
ncbi:MAG: hypothetical protein QOD89_1169 [Bradyrhizobium sp.]|nr:hypothetical protein [Bradyrhizobium sp.]